MSTLYFELQGPSWYIDRNWLKGPSPCSNNWHGVSCADGKIIIELHRNNLRGSLPIELGLLSTLEVLNVQESDIGGTLPREIGYLAGLVKINARFTNLGGTIPETLGDCGNLEVLDLSDTQMSGNIPSEIGDLGSLGEFFSWPSITLNIPTEHLLTPSFCDFKSPLPCQGRT
jgi:hypothetical protein